MASLSPGNPGPGGAGQRQGVWPPTTLRRQVQPLGREPEDPPQPSAGQGEAVLRQSIRLHRDTGVRDTYLPKDDNEINPAGSHFPSK